MTIEKTERTTATTEKTDPTERSQPLRWAIVALVVLALAAAIVFGVLADRAADRARDRADALAAAKSRVPTLLSYDHRTLERDLARSKDQTTGRFRTDYTKLLDGPIAKAAAQKRITTKATLSGAGVVEPTGSRVTVLVFLTQTTTAPGAEPSLSASRVEVTMQRSGDGWKIAGLTPR
ncbi:Mce-associated membrane protein [Nocardioides luteus]|uniref:Mce-associated membrane protein n=1 Tax=Nocardioides luteus TaxID=1844 RepID=A0ABQ5STQ8_9ACTN|nr:hypothetical protein [Nocardioides luteus]MDR7310164.1 Mce-associated membrane protein [Nocardioides luteus]GGR74123.1 hypothetical protein GCM10010197_46690 [Nocardioides luteus]GLJ66929.1 hypothetical protein GCM10017579_09650 [Nocardioides luteus]